MISLLPSYLPLWYSVNRKATIANLSFHRADISAFPLDRVYCLHYTMEEAWTWYRRVLPSLIRRTPELRIARCAMGSPKPLRPAGLMRA